VRRVQGRFREGSGLTEKAPDICRLAVKAGFQRAGFVDPSLLLPFQRKIETLVSRGWFTKQSLSGMELDWVVHPERWASTCAIFICALSCIRPEPDDLSSRGDPHALIAPFARRNHYAAAVRMLAGALKPVANALGFSRKSVRFFSNSRIPEKPLAVASGLACYGVNGLALIPGLGSGFIIAGAVLPIPGRDIHPAVGGAAFAETCRSCRRCREACPTGAIVEQGIVDPERCLQGLASRPLALDPAGMEAWGPRLYGCQECQRVCPENGALTESSAVSEGEMGPSVSLLRFLSLDSAGVKALVRKTAMGMSWVSPEALLRNALIAAGNRGDDSLSPLVSHHAQSDIPLIRDTARWALERIRSGRVSSVSDVLRRRRPG
jgi:epoxyqueuosine reductase